MPPSPLNATASLIPVLILFLWACGDRSGIATESRQHALIGGIEDDEDASVVLVRIKTGDGLEGLCTGTVIGRRTVLTAAHCLAPQSVGQGANFSIFLEPDSRDAAPPPGRTLEVARTEFDPEFDADLLHRGHDIGALFTVTPIGTPRVVLGREPLPAEVPDLRMVGYGVSAATDADGVTAGRRRQARVPVQAVRGAFVDVGTAALGPCLGDSGGPALFRDAADSEERLVGLVSYSPRACGGGALLTAISAYLPLLDGWLAGEDIAPEEPTGCSVTGRELPSTGLASLWPWMLLCVALLARPRKNRRADTL